jgi:MFS family permease
MRPDSSQSLTSAHSVHSSKQVPDIFTTKDDVGSGFALFDHISASVDIPRFVTYIIPLWITFQTVLCALWLPGSTLADRLPSLSSFANLFSVLGAFSSADGSDAGLMTALVVAAAFFVVMAIVQGIVLFCFTVMHTYISQLLLPCRVLIELAPIIMAFPAAYVAGAQLAAALGTGEWKAAVFFVIGALLLIGFLVIFRLTFDVLGGSPFLPPSVLAYFEAVPFLRHMISLPLFFALSHASVALDGWFWYFLVAGHALAHVYFAYGYTARPFITDWMNNLCFCLCAFSILMDILAIAQRLALDSPPLQFVLVFVFAAVSIVITYLFSCLIHRRVERILSMLTEDSAQTEEENYRLFDRLHFNSSARTALFFLNQGIRNQQMRLCHFTYVTYILANFQDTSVVSRCARVVAWLPYMARPLNWLCSQLGRRRNLRLAHRFMLFQLSNIRLTRESSSSHAAAQKLISLKTLTASTSQTIRLFWDRSECSLGLLRIMSRERAQADMTWREAMEDFPNNQHFRNLYITYCIESVMRYGEAVFQKSQTELLEAGANFLRDNCFRRFVRTWPHFLKHRIVDSKGGLVQNERHSSRSASTRDHSNLNETLDQAVEESIGRAILLQARLRLTVERAFEGRTPYTFPRVVAAAIALLVITLGTFIALAVHFQSYFDGLNAVAERLQYLNSARM